MLARQRPMSEMLRFGACVNWRFVVNALSPRKCIGDQFALTEATLILATLAQQYRVRLAPTQRIALERLITQRPKYGMHIFPEKLT